MGDQRFEGKVAVITGATGGIGSALVKRFSSEGAAVVALGRSEARLQALQDECSTKIHGRTLDFADSTSSQQVASDLAGEFDHIDILINNAGVVARKAFDQMDVGELEHVMEVNFTNQVRFTQPIYRSMVKHRYGKIVNVSSLSGKRGYAGGSAYVSSKFALLGFTQCLAHEGAPYGINVNAVCPGYVETAMARKAFQIKADEAGMTADSMRGQIESDIPAGRIAEPGDVVSVIRFLCSDASAYIIGQAWNIDGGQLFQ